MRSSRIKKIPGMHIWSDEKRKRASLNRRGKKKTPGFVKKQRERMLAGIASELAIKAGKTLRKTRYAFNGQFYDSQSEATVATLLENYVPGFRIEEGKTFQINHKIPKTLDFLVDGEFLEWHPILMFAGKNGLGDIDSPEKYQKFKSIKSKFSPERAKVFKRRYNRLLASNYLTQRQAAVNESQTYAGMNVRLVQTPEELYCFLTEKGCDLPDQGQFVQEFKQIKAQVKEANKKEAA
ncbi:MAG: hypothetical protein KKD18_00745 [Nanoarchaeota archaeon]|nr:hypothetical protein [Nanoarchaeota archaeon]